MPEQPPTTPPHSDREQKLRTLRELLRNQTPNQPRGVAPLQAEPTSEWRRLTGEIGPRRLIDCLAGSPGSGAGLVALWLCTQASRERGELVVIDRDGAFYPPTAIAWGVDARRLLVVRARSDADALAAAEIALRSPAASAVWAQLGRIDGRQFRRLLLATEAASAFGALVRTDRYVGDPSWADVQLRFDPVASQAGEEAPLVVRASQTRNRHGPAGGSVNFAIDWTTGTLCPMSSDTDVEAPQPNLAASSAASSPATHHAGDLAARLAGSARSA
ncbi:MAG: hypothetical protein AAFV43_09330 [Planctomycetota bacterium]